MFVLLWPIDALDEQNTKFLGYTKLKSNEIGNHNKKQPKQNHINLQLLFFQRNSEVVPYSYCLIYLLTIVNISFYVYLIFNFFFFLVE